jgi:uncharacterized membrane protein
MKLTSEKFFIGIILATAIFNILAFFNVDFFYFRAPLSFTFLAIVPGLLIATIIGFKKIGFWNFLVYTIGLSVASLMLWGLFSNWTLFELNISNKPLSFVPLIGSFDLFLLILSLAAYRHRNNLVIDFSLPTFGRLNKIFFAIPTLFPFFSIFGAIVLNNGGSNYLTMILLGGIAMYVFFATILRNRLDESIYPYSIFLIGLSLLLMFSMRSWHISGWDIQQEFEMFQITKNLGFWTPASMKDAYNTCLSLTILPTVISRFTGIGDEYVFKIFYQLLFAFVPVTLYCLYKNYAPKAVCFLASFFFISQIFFVQQMPALARQEIAFLFFALILLVLFQKKIIQKTKNILFVFFGFSMVVSHYSTTYVAIGLFFATYFLFQIYRWLVGSRFAEPLFKFFKRNMENRCSDFQGNIKIAPLLGLIFLTFFWGMIVTNSASDLFKAIGNTTGSMKQMFSNDLKSWEIQSSLSIFAPPNDNTAANITKYNVDEIKRHDALSSAWERYPNSDSIALNPVSSLMVKPKIEFMYSGAILILLAIIKFLAKLLTIIGLCYVVIRGPRSSGFDPEYLILCVLGVGTILAMYILPVVSQEYNLSRLYMQILILISIPAVFGVMLLTIFFGKKLRAPILAGFFILNFLYILGFFNQIFGGTASLTLNNFGDDYDRFYTHSAEVYSAKWLAANRDDKIPIFADFLSSLKLKSFAFINGTDEAILPSVITRNSYFYLSYANVIQGRADAIYKNIALTYSYPTEFLTENKNLIYSNGESKIFR